jgi:hypothetical protein
MPTNPGTKPPADYPPPTGDIVNYPTPAEESAAAGYEMTDVNAGGVVVFIGGLFGFVIIFFFFCFFMGRLINSGLEAEDGKTDKWHQKNTIFAGALANGGKREDLKSNAAMQQQELGQMVNAFPNPRLDIDDGNQATADLHAREDLYLDHYSTVPGEPLRIPIDRAMELIAAKGLPVSQAATPSENLAEDKVPVVQTPLTTGFARTGYELDTIEARKQKMDFEGAEHAETKPIK